MLSLFEEPDNLPAGFQYFPDFISPDEEIILLEEINSLPLKPMRFQGYEAKRKVLNFGMDWSFEKRSLNKGTPIPPQFKFLLEKAALQLQLQPSDFAELLLTEYPEGAVINWHRDAPPFHLIAGISLMNDCKFRFRPYGKVNRKRSDIRTIEVKSRSMYVMSGESRSDYEHSIAAMDVKRYSVTMRTLL